MLTSGGKKIPEKNPMGKHKKPAFRNAAVCACGAMGFVGLTRGFVAFFSPADWDEIYKRNWGVMCCPRGGYARSSTCLGGGQSGLMHRVITGAQGREVVDHINGDRLDNRRENLRVCRFQENTWNRRKAHGASRFKGVHRQGPCWGFSVKKGAEVVREGGFSTEIEAAKAYDHAAVRLHGAFACTNADLGKYDQEVST